MMTEGGGYITRERGEIDRKGKKERAEREIYLK